MLRGVQTEDLTRNRETDVSKSPLPRNPDLRRNEAELMPKKRSSEHYCLMGQATTNCRRSNFAPRSLFPVPSSYLVPISTNIYSPSHLLPHLLRFHSFGFIRLLPNQCLPRAKRFLRFSRTTSLQVLEENKVCTTPCLKNSHTPRSRRIRAKRICTSSFTTRFIMLAASLTSIRKLHFHFGKGH